MNNKQQSLTLAFLGGVGEVGKNMLALEYGGEILVIDCGLTFPSDDMPGIDIVIPDDTYLVNNRARIKGIILTHGHEDHIGALPYMLDKIKAPVFGSRLTLALLENKLKEKRINNAKLNSVKAGSVIKLGNFSIEFLKVTHSISGALALVITTPVGVYFHTGDFKIDMTPIDGDGMDFARLAEIGKKKVLVMTADSTNAERKGFSMSEKRVGMALEEIFLGNKTKRIFLATFSSNIHRVQQVLNLAEKYGRKVAFGGRSMINVCETAAKIGELTYNTGNIIDIKNIDKYPDNELCIISTGTQGETTSALTRMSNGEFPKIEIGENDLIILSSSVIPGNEKAINRVVNQLFKLGATVTYESLAEVHVSGHAYQEELKLIHSLLQPKFFIPCHGEYRHLRAHANLAMEMGMPARNIMIPELGNKISVNKNSLKLLDNVQAGAILVDGSGMGEIDGNIIRERSQLSKEGMCVVTLTISHASGVFSSEPNVIVRGLMYNEKEIKEIEEEAKIFMLTSINNINFKMQDWEVVKNMLQKSLTGFFNKRYRCKPVILPLIIETN